MCVTRHDFVFPLNFHSHQKNKDRILSLSELKPLTTESKQKSFMNCIGPFRALIYYLIHHFTYTFND